MASPPKAKVAKVVQPESEESSSESSESEEEVIKKKVLITIMVLFLTRVLGKKIDCVAVQLLFVLSICSRTAED